MQERQPDWRTHGAEMIVQGLEENERAAYGTIGEGLVTNVARVARSCTCSTHIIHDGSSRKRADAKRDGHSET